METLRFQREVEMIVCTDIAALLLVVFVTFNSCTCNNAVFIIVTDEPLEELELAPPFVMMLCIEWIVVSTINIYINILVLNIFKSSRA